MVDMMVIVLVHISEKNACSRIFTVRRRVFFLFLSPFFNKEEEKKDLKT